jgi:hypothetical protein
LGRTKNNNSRSANKITLSLLYAVFFLPALILAGQVAADITFTWQPQDAKAAVERLPADLANTPSSFTPLQAPFDTATPTRRTPIPAETICRMVMINVRGTDPASTTLLCASPCDLNSNSGLDPGDPAASSTASPDDPVRDMPCIIQKCQDGINRGRIR